MQHTCLKARNERLRAKRKARRQQKGRVNETVLLETGRQTDRQTDKERQRERDRQTETKRERERQTATDIDRDTERNYRISKNTQQKIIKALFNLFIKKNTSSIVNTTV